MHARSRTGMHAHTPVSQRPQICLLLRNKNKSSVKETQRRIIIISEESASNMCKCYSRFTRKRIWTTHKVLKHSFSRRHKTATHETKLETSSESNSRIWRNSHIIASVNSVLETCASVLKLKWTGKYTIWKVHKKNSSGIQSAGR